MCRISGTESQEKTSRFFFSANEQNEDNSQNLLRENSQTRNLLNDSPAIELSPSGKSLRSSGPILPNIAQDYGLQCLGDPSVYGLPCMHSMQLGRRLQIVPTNGRDQQTFCPLQPAVEFLIQHPRLLWLRGPFFGAAAVAILCCQEFEGEVGNYSHYLSIQVSVNREPSTVQPLSSAWRSVLSRHPRLLVALVKATLRHGLRRKGVASCWSPLAASTMPLLIIGEEIDYGDQTLGCPCSGPAC